MFIIWIKKRGFLLIFKYAIEFLNNQLYFSKFAKTSVKYGAHETQSHLVKLKNPKQKICEPNQLRTQLNPICHAETQILDLCRPSTRCYSDFKVTSTSVKLLFAMYNYLNKIFLRYVPSLFHIFWQSCQSNIFEFKKCLKVFIISVVLFA